MCGFRRGSPSPRHPTIQERQSFCMHAVFGRGFFWTTVKLHPKTGGAQDGNWFHKISIKRRQYMVPTRTTRSLLPSWLPQFPSVGSSHPLHLFTTSTSATAAVVQRQVGHITEYRVPPGHEAPPFFYLRPHSLRCRHATMSNCRAQWPISSSPKSVDNILVVIRLPNFCITSIFRRETEIKLSTVTTRSTS